MHNYRVYICHTTTTTKPKGERNAITYIELFTYFLSLFSYNRKTILKRIIREKKLNMS